VAGDERGTVKLQRIMLADDEPDILEISKIALETIGGYEVAVYTSGRALLAQLTEFEPDLIVVDVLMPDLTGPQVLEQIRRVPGYAETPVVYLTGVMQKEGEDDLRTTGPVDIILKPFDPMTLADHIDSIWREIHGG
jgi:CheY-like chemotaxis protein